MNDPLTQAGIDGNADVALAMTQALLASGGTVVIGTVEGDLHGIGAGGHGANSGMSVERAKELVN